MANIISKLGDMIDLEELGDKIDLGKIKDKIDLKELGSKFDLDHLTDVLNERKAKKATRWVIIVLAVIGVAAIAIGAAYFVHHYLTPAYTDDFDDDFEDFEDEEEDF